jgi:hypothetical protein
MNHLSPDRREASVKTHEQALSHIDLNSSDRSEALQPVAVTHYQRGLQEKVPIKNPAQGRVF